MVLLFSAMLLLTAAFGSLAITVADGFLGAMAAAFCGLLAVQGLRSRVPAQPQRPVVGAATGASPTRRNQAPAAPAIGIPRAGLRPFAPRRNIHQPS